MRHTKTALAATMVVVAAALATTGQATASPAPRTAPAPAPAPQSEAVAPQWTSTPTNREPATLSDVDSKAGVTWAVGGDQVADFQDQRPLLMRWTGTKWQAAPQPVQTNAELGSVAVGSASNVWAVGEDRANPEKTLPLAMHWNGTKWSVVPPPAVPTGSFSDVAIAPDGSVWASGWANVDGTEHAAVYRYAGGKWQPLTTGLEQSINGNALAVLSATNAWLGLNGGLAHFDGTRWTLVKEVPDDGSHIPTSFVVAGPKNIWMVGVQYTPGTTPMVMHYDGTTWTSVATPAVEAQMYDVVLRNNRPLVVGERLVRSGQTISSKPYALEYDGSKLVAAPTPKAAVGTLTGLSADADRVWTVGMTSLSLTAPYSALAAYTG